MTIQQVHIRRARKADLPALAHFARAMADVHIGFDSCRFIVPDGGDAAFAEFFRLELDRAEAVLLIAEDEQGTVGYAFVRMENASLVELRGAGAWLHDLYVASGARRRGVGRLLLESAKQAARELGSTSLMLGMSPHNGPARRL